MPQTTMRDKLSVSIFGFILINLEIQRSSLENPLSEIPSRSLIPSEISSQVSSIPATSNLGSIESSLRSETPYSIASDICEL